MCLLLPFQGDATTQGGDAVEFLDLQLNDNPALSSGATHYFFVELVDTILTYPAKTRAAAATLAFSAG